MIKILLIEERGVNLASITNTAFMKLSKRAEINERSKLVATFVDIGPLFTLLSNKDHQILYGRRGTGKTHALSYLAEIVQREGNAVIYLDMRTIGSTGGLYSDTTMPIAQRATRLLLDTLSDVHSSLFEYLVTEAENFNLSYTGPLLDRFAEAISEVVVVGNVERENKSASNLGLNNSSNLNGSLSSEGPKLEIGHTSSQSQQRQAEHRLTETGIAEQRVQFGYVGKTLTDIAAAIRPKRIWLVLDEWSSIPIDLQPYLADLIRRAIFPVSGLTVKIATIEQRSQFRIASGQGAYIGIELGADVAADLSLDDFMVFENDAERAKQFFQELLFKHYQAAEGVDASSGPRSAVELIHEAFVQRTAFDEFVRATEGVPRDAINIATLAAQRALDDRISVNHVRVAARNWYQRDKEASVKAIQEAHTLLHWIIDKVIGERRARTFLLRSDISHELIDALFDARVLHVLKKNISGHDQPGVRYDAYKLDYGCYVDLITTQKSPLSQPLDDFIEKGDEDDLAAVPPDDYRAIRRAILNINEFKNHIPAGYETFKEGQDVLQEPDAKQLKIEGL